MNVRRSSYRLAVVLVRFLTQMHFCSRVLLASQTRVKSSEWRMNSYRNSVLRAFTQRRLLCVHSGDRTEWSSWYCWVFPVRSAISNRTVLVQLLHTVCCWPKSHAVYTGCPRRNVPDFGRVFLMLKYIDITQNTYVQIWTVTEIMVREVWNFDSCYTLIDYQIHIKTVRNVWFL